MILYTTWPDAETAQAAGRAAVEARLAACANVMAPMISVYLWKDVVEQTGETPLLLKTTTAAADRLRDFILARHPYDTPCIVGIPTLDRGSNPEFVNWITRQIASNTN
jgi:periplasmic divalent cation tolerance protein